MKLRELINRRFRSSLLVGVIAVAGSLCPPVCAAFASPIDSAPSADHHCCDKDAPTQTPVKPIGSDGCCTQISATLPHTVDLSVPADNYGSPPAPPVFSAELSTSPRFLALSKIAPLLERRRDRLLKPLSIAAQAPPLS